MINHLSLPIRVFGHRRWSISTVLFRLGNLDVVEEGEILKGECLQVLLAIEVHHRLEDAYESFIVQVAERLLQDIQFGGRTLKFILLLQDRHNVSIFG
jgi:hypothetical protein